jgi:hypothetical protein
MLEIDLISRCHDRMKEAFCGECGREMIWDYVNRTEVAGGNVLLFSLDDFFPIDLCVAQIESSCK